MSKEFITDAFVRKVLQNEGLNERKIFDSDLSGFFIRRRTASSGPYVTYFLRYTDERGRDKTMKIGRASSSLTASHARKSAQLTRAKVELGNDPLADKRIKRGTLSIGEILDLYLKSPEFDRKSDSTRRNETNYIENHIRYRLRSVQTDEITPAFIRSFGSEIRADKRVGKRKRRLGGEGAERKVIRLLSAILSLALENGWIERHPFIGQIKLRGDGVRDVVITQQDEYHRLFSSLDELLAEGKINLVANVFFKIAAVTGARRGELMNLVWRDIDFLNARFRILNSKGARLSRSVKSQEYVHIPAIGIQALQYLKTQVDCAQDAKVFPSAHGKTFETARLWRKVREHAALPEGLTIHGLRHSLGTIAAIQGHSTLQIQNILRHRQPSTTAHYVHLSQTLAHRPIDGIVDALIPALPIVAERRD